MQRIKILHINQNKQTVPRWRLLEGSNLPKSQKKGIMPIQIWGRTAQSGAILGRIVVSPGLTKRRGFVPSMNIEPDNQSSRHKEERANFIGLNYIIDN